MWVYRVGMSKVIQVRGVPDEVHAELEKVFEKSWDGYTSYRKSPRKRTAGPGYADPTMQLQDDPLEARSNRKLWTAREGAAGGDAKPAGDGCGCSN